MEQKKVLIIGGSHFLNNISFALNGKAEMWYTADLDRLPAGSQHRKFSGLLIDTDLSGDDSKDFVRIRENFRQVFPDANIIGCNAGSVQTAISLLDMT